MKLILRALAVTAGLMLGIAMVFPLPVLGAEVDTWSTTAGNNNSSAPDGWPENMAPSGVNDAAREVMAAIKRWYDDTQPSIVSTGSGNVYAMAASRTVATYATGQVFSFIANHNNTGAVNVNVDTVGEKDLLKPNGDELSSGDIIIGQHVLFSYSGTGDSFQVLSSVGSGGLSSPVAVADGGTGSTTAAAARIALGLLIESDVQAHDGGLSDIASAATTDGNILVGDGSTWVAESGATARTSLGITTPELSESYDSGNQTITNGGSLTLSHGLAATPDIMEGYLVNATADCGYVPGQIITSGFFDSNTTQRGFMLSATNATQIFVRFASDGFILLNNDNGTSCAPTSSSWRLVIRAYN